MSSLRQRLTQILASAISAALIATSSQLAQAAPSVAPDALERFAPARNLGYLTDMYRGSSDRTVILIQDLHLHYPTQTRILKILDYLYAKGLVTGPLAVEGVDGPYDTSKIASYPAGKIKSELVDYFMKKGELSAPEAFSVLRGDGHLLYGVDKAQYYDLNRNLFKASREDRKTLQARLTRIQKGLALLKHQNYSYALQHLDKEEAYGMAAAERLLNQKLALCPDDMTRNLFTADHMLRLTERLVRQEVTLEEARYIAQRLPAFTELTDNLLNSDNAVIASVAKQSITEETLKSSVDFYLVALMRNQPMAENTLRLIGRNSPKAEQPGVGSIQKAEQPDSGITQRPLSGSSAVSHFSRSAFPPPGSSDVIVLVAGGFHTAGLTKAFKAAGISYVVITPSIPDAPDAAYRELYENRLAGMHMPLSEFAKDFGLKSEIVPDKDSLMEGEEMVAVPADLGFLARAFQWVFRGPSIRPQSGGRFIGKLTWAGVLVRGEIAKLSPWASLPEAIQANPQYSVALEKSSNRYFSNNDNSHPQKVSFNFVDIPQGRENDAAHAFRYRPWWWFGGSRIVLDRQEIEPLVKKIVSGSAEEKKAAEWLLDLRVHHELSHSSGFTERQTAMTVLKGIAALFALSTPFWISIHLFWPVAFGTIFLVGITIPYYCLISRLIILKFPDSDLEEEEGIVRNDFNKYQKLARTQSDLSPIDYFTVSEILSGSPALNSLKSYVTALENVNKERTVEGQNKALKNIAVASVKPLEKDYIRTSPAETGAQLPRTPRQTLEKLTLGLGIAGWVPFGWIEAPGSDNRVVPAAPAGRELKGAVAVTVRIGATNIAIELVDRLGSTNNLVNQKTFQWSDIAKQLGRDTGDIAGMANGMVAYLGAEITQLLQANGVSTQRVTELGISFAGPVEEGAVTSTNMAVHFDGYRLGEELLKNIPGFEAIPVRTLNDAEAGAIGEVKDQRGKMRSGRGAYLIWGTGFGGTVLRSLMRWIRWMWFDRKVREMGHTILRSNTDGTYSYRSIDELASSGHFKDGKFTTPEGYTELEHRVAGPWMVIRFLNEHAAEPGWLESLRDAIRADLNINIDLSKLEALTAVADLPVRQWGEKADAAAVKAVSAYILSSRNLDTDLGHQARGFELSLYKELELALKALRIAVPDLPIVLGSSQAELRRNDPEFIAMLNRVGGKVVVSDLNSSRENAAFAPTPAARLAVLWAQVKAFLAQQWKSFNQTRTSPAAPGAIVGSKQGWLRRSVTKLLLAIQLLTVSPAPTVPEWKSPRADMEWTALSASKENLRNVLTNVNQNYHLELDETYLRSFRKSLTWFIDRLKKSTAGVRGEIQTNPLDILEGDQLNAGDIFLIAQAYADYITSNFPSVQDGKKVERAAFVGFDPRFFSKEFAEIFTRVFVANGIKVYRDRVEGAAEVCQTATPVSSYAAYHLHAASAIEITSSHNKYVQNGVKSQKWTGGVDIDSIGDQVAARANDLFESAEKAAAEGLKPPQVHVGMLEDPELVSYVDAKKLYYEGYWKRLFPPERMGRLQKIFVKLSEQGKLSKVLFDSLCGVGAPTFKYYLHLMFNDSAYRNLDRTIWESRFLYRNDTTDPYILRLEKPDPSDPKTIAAAGDLEVLSEDPDILELLMADMDADRTGTGVLINLEQVKKARDLGLLVTEMKATQKDGTAKTVFIVRFTANQFLTLMAYGRALEAVRVYLGLESENEAARALHGELKLGLWKRFKLYVLRQSMILVTTVPSSMITSALMRSLGGNVINCCVGFKYLGDQGFNIDKTSRQWWHPSTLPTFLRHPIKLMALFLFGAAGIIIGILEESGGGQITPVGGDLIWDKSKGMTIHEDKDTLTCGMESFYHSFRLAADGKNLIDFYQDMAGNLGGLFFYERDDLYLPTRIEAEDTAQLERTGKIKEAMAQKAEYLEKLEAGPRLVELMRDVFPEGTHVQLRSSKSIIVKDAVFLLKQDFEDLGVLASIWWILKALFLRLFGKTVEGNGAWVNVNPKGVLHTLSNGWTIQTFHIGTKGKEGPAVRIFNEKGEEVARTCFRKSGTESLIRLYKEILEPIQEADPHRVYKFFRPLSLYLGFRNFTLRAGTPGPQVYQHDSSGNVVLNEKSKKPVPAVGEPNYYVTSATNLEGKYPHEPADLGQLIPVNGVDFAEKIAQRMGRPILGYVQSEGGAFGVELGSVLGGETRWFVISNFGLLQYSGQFASGADEDTADPELVTIVDEELSALRHDYLTSSREVERRAHPNAHREWTFGEQSQAEYVRILAALQNGVPAGQAVRSLLEKVPGVTPEQVQQTIDGIGAAYKLSLQAVPAGERGFIGKAFALAAVLHAGQPRAEGDTRPHLIHTAFSVRLLLTRGQLESQLDQADIAEVIAAEWLHNTVEDVHKSLWGAPRAAQDGEEPVKSDVQILIESRLSPTVLARVNNVSKPEYAEQPISVQADVEAQKYHFLQHKDLGTKLVKVFEVAANFLDLHNHPNRAFPELYLGKRLAPLAEFLETDTRMDNRVKTFLVSCIEVALEQNPQIRLTPMQSKALEKLREMFPAPAASQLAGTQVAPAPEASIEELRALVNGHHQAETAKAIFDELLKKHRLVAISPTKNGIRDEWLIEVTGERVVTVGQYKPNGNGGAVSVQVGDDTFAHTINEDNTYYRILPAPAAPREASQELRAILEQLKKTLLPYRGEGPRRVLPPIDLIGMALLDNKTLNSPTTSTVNLLKSAYGVLLEFRDGILGADIMLPEDRESLSEQIVALRSVLVDLLHVDPASLEPVPAPAAPGASGLPDVTGLNSLLLLGPLTALASRLFHLGNAGSVAGHAIQPAGFNIPYGHEWLEMVVFLAGVGLAILGSDLLKRLLRIRPAAPAAAPLTEDETILRRIVEINSPADKSPEEKAAILRAVRDYPASILPQLLQNSYGFTEEKSKLLITALVGVGLRSPSAIQEGDALHYGQMFYSISVPLMLLMGAASPDSSDLSSYPLIVPGVVFLLLVFWVVRDIETLGRNRGNASGSASDALIASPPDNSMKAFIERHFGYLFMIPGGEDGIGPLWDILNNYDDKKNKGIPDWVGLHQSLMVLGVNESTAKEIMKEMQSNQWTLPDNPLAHIHRAAKGQKGLATGKSTIASFAEALPWAPEWLVNFLASTIGILHINELGMFANPFNSALIRDEHLDHASLAVAAFWVMRAATVAGAVLMAHNAHGASGSIVAFLVGAAGSYLATHLLINLVFMAYQAVGLANQAVNKTYSDEDRVNLAFSGLFGATFMALFSGAHQLSLESAGLSVTLGLLVTMGTWIILRQRARAQAEAVAAAMIPVMQAMNSATLLGERLKNPRGLIGVFLSKLSGEDPNLSKRIEEEAPKLANEGA